MQRRDPVYILALPALLALVLDVDRLELERPLLTDLRQLCLRRLYRKMDELQREMQEVDGLRTSQSEQCGPEKSVSRATRAIPRAAIQELVLWKLLGHQNYLSCEIGLTRCLRSLPMMALYKAKASTR